MTTQENFPADFDIGLRKEMYPYVKLAIEDGFRSGETMDTLINRYGIESVEDALTDIEIVELYDPSGGADAA